VTAVAEVEATAVHAPGTDMTPYARTAVEEYRPRIIMAAEDAKALDDSLRAMMKAVLRDGADYGVIPGTGSKPTLLKPGAEKLLQWFGFGHATERVESERDENGARLGVTYKCSVTKAMQDGRVVTVATCEGYAGYDEDRFYTTAEQARAKAEANERKWAAKDNRPANPKKWESAAEYRAPWNSVIKMAQKRALVGAALQATSGSTLFTQDLEDMRDADSGGSQFAEAAGEAIMALADDVREALDKWWRGKRWPDPSRWSAEQWCAALQTAGYLTANREQPKRSAAQEQPAAPASGAAQEPGTGADSDDPEAEFVRRFVARVPDADETACRSMRVELGKAVSAKVISPEIANELGQSLTERMTQVRSAA
jgi:hypothetical protein